MVTINLSQANFLCNLFGNYRDKLYYHMVKNNYPMQNTLDFISGYTAIAELCGKYLMDIEMRNGFDPVTNSKCVLFNNANEMISAMEVAIKAIYDRTDYPEWEEIGHKYARSFAMFYITCGLFGEQFEIEEGLYQDIPDKEDPDSYEWVWLS